MRLTSALSQASIFFAILSWRWMSTLARCLSSSISARIFASTESRTFSTFANASSSPSFAFSSFFPFLPFSCFSPSSSPPFAFFPLFSGFSTLVGFLSLLRTLFGILRSSKYALVASSSAFFAASRSNVRCSCCSKMGARATAHSWRNSWFLSLRNFSARWSSALRLRSFVNHSSSRWATRSSILFQTFSRLTCISCFRLNSCSAASASSCLICAL
mmetsp:Transcript_8395/g.21464  ORF Transcript_8395/g.21464 Transcript_8395/m.21464 type:complete len:216 (-) Transcript_8395:905-1552(-)